MLMPPGIDTIEAPLVHSQCTQASLLPFLLPWEPRWSTSRGLPLPSLPATNPPSCHGSGR